MKFIIGIIYLIIGLVTLGTIAIKTIKEKDRKTYWKIMIAASSGVFVSGGLILIFF